MDQQNKIQITPETKISQLLDSYPELEETLIEITPAFKKLKNPVLRKTIAKITTLRQAAKIGNVSLAELINRLRGELGMALSEHISEDNNSESHARPAWFNESKITNTVDARPMLEAGQEPVKFVFKDLNQLESGQIFELITPFEPAPLIQMAKEKGFQVWIQKVTNDVVKTYFLSDKN